MNNTESKDNNAILESICDPIFFKTLFNNPYNQKWHKSYLEDYLHSIAYTTRSKGVEIKVHVSMDMKKGTKANASLYIGNYHQDKSYYFSSDISFSITKKNCNNDFINRLGLKDIEIHVANILNERERTNKDQEDLELKKQILKRYLPFKDTYNYTDGLTAYLGKNKDVEISHINSSRSYLKVSGDIDFLMKLCAFIRDNQD